MKFTIYGNPVSKGRPRFSRRGNFAYTDEKTVSYENLVKLSFLEQIEDKMKYLTEDKKELKAVITAYYSIPKSTSNKKRELMIAKKIRPTKKPDLDNISKIILDSLNGLAYKDDSQIVTLELKKYYGEQPRVEVELKGQEYVK